MKVLILGDTHFGASYSLGKNDTNTYLNTRLIDFSNTFDYVIDYMYNNDIKHFILTGDIFEHRRPQASELSLFSDKIKKLIDMNIETHIVVGNHDIIREHRATTVDVLGSLKLPSINIHSDINGVVIGNKINVIFFPFRTKEMLDCVTNTEAVNRLSDHLEYQLKTLNNNLPSIVVGHFMMQGTKIGNVVLEATPREVVLPASMFKCVDAVIMGHVHAHMIIKSKKPFITYIGSMECQDFGESKYDKYFLILDTDKMKYTFEKLPVRKIHDISIDQTFASNGKEASINACKNISHLKLEDSIVKVTIMINEKCLFDLDREYIKKTLRKQFKVYHCVGIYPQIFSKRQLRKASITEGIDPLISFNDYLELEEDAILREGMRIIGTQIIKERGKI
jgi:exonuclease SbcD